MPRKPKCNKYDVLYWVLHCFPIDYIVYEQQAHINSVNAMLNNYTVDYVMKMKEKLLTDKRCEVPEENIDMFIELGCDVKAYYKHKGYAEDDFYSGIEK